MGRMAYLLLSMTIFEIRPIDNSVLASLLKISVVLTPRRTINFIGNRESCWVKIGQVF